MSWLAGINRTYLATLTRVLVVVCLALVALAPAIELADEPVYAVAGAAANGDADHAGDHCGPTPSCSPVILVAPDAWQRLARGGERIAFADSTGHDLWTFSPRAPVPILFA